MWEEYRIPSSQLGKRSNLPLLGSSPRSFANVAILMLTKVLSEARNTKSSVSLEKLVYMYMYVLKVSLLLL